MLRSWITVLAVCWAIASSLCVYPHSLAYFNELVHGPEHGAEHLIHSNIDWGQDLLKLKDWLRQHSEVGELRLAYFGSVDPAIAGIEYKAPTPFSATVSAHDHALPPGWYAISANFVRGFPAIAYKGDGTRFSYGQDALTGFQKLTPAAKIGYSIYLYHVTDG